MSAGRKMLWVFLMALLWGAATFLAFECYERIRQVRAERAYEEYIRQHVGTIPGMIRAGQMDQLENGGTALEDAQAQESAVPAGESLPHLDPDPKRVAEALPVCPGPPLAATAPAVRANRETLASRNERNKQAFAELDSDARASEVENRPRAPEDSHWDIEQFRYKKGFNRGVVVTNNFGFKDHDVVVPRPAGLFRIACVGGSTVEEGDVSAPRTTTMLQESLDAHFGPGKVEVLNCGICGLDSRAERQHAQDYLALEPNLILHYNAVNDVSVDNMAKWSKQVTLCQRVLRQSRLINRLFNRALMPSDATVTQHMNATTLLNMRTLACAALERNTGIVFCSFAYPNGDRLERVARDFLDINFRSTWAAEGDPSPDFSTYCAFMDLHNRLVKEMCADLGLLYIPVEEHFDVGIDHFQDICHVTPRGMRRKADIMAAYLIPYIERAMAAAG